MKRERLTDNHGYALTEKRILEITEELNGVYYGYNLGALYDKDGNYTEQYKTLEAKGYIGRMDERDNALVCRPMGAK